LRRDLQECKEQLSQKEELLHNLNTKYDELISCQTIELPIYSKPKKGTSKKAINKLSNNNMSRSKSQNRVKHLQFVRELAEEEDFLEDEMASLCGEEQSMRSVLGKQKNQSKINTSISQAYPYLQGITDIDQVITNQIIAAKMAESALKDLEGEAEVKYEDIQGAMGEAASINLKFSEIKKERDELQQRV
jgi:hypothetical protein